MGEKLYGVWYQKKCERLRLQQWWNELEQGHRFTSDVRIAKAMAYQFQRSGDLMGCLINVSVCEVGEDGQPCNCDKELWEDE